jgi:N-acyl homoserine lactone hydrolase
MLMRLFLFQLASFEPAGAPVPGYLIQTDDGTNILVDTGAPRTMIGMQKQAAAQVIAAYGNDAQMIPTAWSIRGVRFEEQDLVIHHLATLGLAPHDINYVICTHFDWDHAGNHDLFPAAEFVVQRRHYEIARDHPRFRLFGAPWDTPALRYRLVEGDSELLPGIALIESGGHVPAHQSVLVRLPETGPVLLAIDAIANRGLLDPQAADAVSDMDHDAARASVRKLVGIAAREGAALVVFGHDAEQWRTLRKAPERYE